MSISIRHSSLSGGGREETRILVSSCLLMVFLLQHLLRCCSKHVQLHPSVPSLYFFSPPLLLIPSAWVAKVKRRLRNADSKGCSYSPECIRNRTSSVMDSARDPSKSSQSKSIPIGTKKYDVTGRKMINAMKNYL